MKKILTIFLLLLFAAFPLAAKLMITAKLDSANLLMGNITMLHLQVVKNENQKGDFTFLKDANREGLVGFLNDTIELRTSCSSDTTMLGSHTLQINYHFPLQCFIPGTYSLPPFKYAIGTDTVSSNQLILKVTGPNVTANDSIAPDVPPVGPYYESEFQKFTDKIPDIIYYYWWIFFIIIGVAIIIYLLVKKRKISLPIIKPSPTPQLPPYEKAIKALKALRDGKLWENGNEQLYYTRLTEILRQYLQGRFNINAMEMTSNQIRNAIKKSPEAHQQRAYMDDVLSMADFVKFAKMRPMPDDNIEAFNNALNFIEKTKPIPAPIDQQSSQKGGSK